MRTTYNYTAAELRDLLAVQTEGARQKLALLFDAGTFAEFGTFVRRADAPTDSTKDAFEGVVTGYGAVDGQLVFAFVQDASREGGAVSAAHADKICALYDMAIQNGAPVVGVFESAGAMLREGIPAMAGYGRILQKVAAASGIIPQIAVISGTCGGASAAIAGMFDFRIGVTGEGKLFAAAAKDAAPITVADGTVDVVSANIVEAMAEAATLLTLLPANNAAGGTFVADADLSRKISIAACAENYDIRDLMRELTNDGKLFEIAPLYGTPVHTALARVGEQVVGIVATDAVVDGGKLTANGAKKAARLLQFCDAFRIPVLTLIDSEGPVSDSSPAFANAMARLAAAYASAVTPRVSVILGNAIGSAFTILGSKSVGADIVLALDSACIGAVTPDAAVQLLWREEIESAENSKAYAAEKKDEWLANYASPLAAARCGAVDDVIACNELRARVIAALGMLSAKCEFAPRRRHATLPL